MKKTIPSFKEFYKQYPDLLFESPLRTGKMYANPLMDNKPLNIENTTEEVLNFPPVGEFALSDHILVAHRDQYEQDKFEDYWVSPRNMSCVHFVFQNIEDNALKARGVWQHRNYRGMAREILFDFYLPSVAYIESDTLHSSQGERYWKSIIKKAQREGYVVNVWNTKTQEQEELVNFEDVWGNTEQHIHKVLRLYSK